MGTVDCLNNFHPGYGKATSNLAYEICANQVCKKEDKFDYTEKCKLSFPKVKFIPAFYQFNDKNINRIRYKKENRNLLKKRIYLMPDLLSSWSQQKYVTLPGRPKPVLNLQMSHKIAATFLYYPKYFIRQTKYIVIIEPGADFYQPSTSYFPYNLMELILNFQSTYKDVSIYAYDKREREEKSQYKKYLTGETKVTIYNYCVGKKSISLEEFKDYLTLN